MANEVINPWQTFRDDLGNPLSGGKLRVFVNETTTLGTAFSDSALAVPQSVDPYTLDSYGRVRADLRWSGLRRLEVRDRNEAFIRTLDDIVTMVDTTQFAINHESVAAMAADTTLIEDDIVETESYNLGQRQGGARYEVTTSALGVDDYLVIDLAPVGLQAQLLESERNNNFYNAGAVGDGVADDTSPVQRLLDVGGDIDCVNGTFLCGPLTLILAARFYGDGTIKRGDFTNAALFAITGTDLIITFDGVTLDGNVANQTAEQTNAIVNSALIASAATALASITFNNVHFLNGSQWDFRGVGDDAGFPIVYNFAQCSFQGGEQSTDTPFITASIRLEEGVSGYIEDCYFALEAVVATGRGAISTGNSATAVVNFGDLTVLGCTLNLMGVELTLAADSRAAVDVTEIGKVIVQGNRLLTPTYSGIAVGAECDDISVTDNLLDGLGTTVIVEAHITLRTSTFAAPGGNLLIDANISNNSAGNAIALDGSTAGADFADIAVANNVIDSPLLSAITYTDVIDLQIKQNFVDMNNVALQHGIQAITNGMAGQNAFEGNELLNVAGTGILDIISATGLLSIDGNTIEGADIGLNIVGIDSLFVTNNVFDTIVTTLGILGTIADLVVDGNSYVGAAPTNFLTQAPVDIVRGRIGENFWQQLDVTFRDIVVTAGINQTVGPVFAKYHVFESSAGGNPTIDTLSDNTADGWQVILRWDAVATTLTLNDGLGNMQLAGNFAFNDVNDTIVLVWNEQNSLWIEASRSNN